MLTEINDYSTAWNFITYERQCAFRAFKFMTVRYLLKNYFKSAHLVYDHQLVFTQVIAPKV
jgi:hypothetical protein